MAIAPYLALVSSSLEAEIAAREESVTNRRQYIASFIAQFGGCVCRDTCDVMYLIDIRGYIYLLIMSSY